MRAARTRCGKWPGKGISLAVGILGLQTENAYRAYRAYRAPQRKVRRVARCCKHLQAKSSFMSSSRTALDAASVACKWGECKAAPS